MFENNVISGCAGLAVSVPEFATIVGLEPTRIRELITTGMPVFKRGGKGVSHTLSTADCIKWLTERDKPKKRPQDKGNKAEDEPDELRQIKIDRARLDLSERRGDLFHLADWKPLIEETLVQSRSIIMKLPDEFRDEFGGENIEAMTRWLKRELTKRLNGVASELFDIPEKASEA